MKLFLILIVTILSFLNAFSQDKNKNISGLIGNYTNQPILLYQCYQDTLILSDSSTTNKQGEFRLYFNKIKNQYIETRGLFKVQLKDNQFFYLLYNNENIKLKTYYRKDQFNNFASDSLEVLSSDENEFFNDFQKLQKKKNIANFYLLKMMRLYPLTDPFHQKMVDEYKERYAQLKKFITLLKSEKVNAPLTLLMAKAYHEPVNPDWKQPDYWRDSIKAAHFFNDFDPSIKFYLYSNILVEKMNSYLKLRNNKVDKYGREVIDEMLPAKAAVSFLEKTISEKTPDYLDNFYFCLNYFLKLFNEEHKERAFIHVYDRFGKPELGYCESENKDLKWAQEKASKIKGLQIGNKAPSFNIRIDEQLNPTETQHQKLLSLANIEDKFTLLLFWATWCMHCNEEVPKIGKLVKQFNKNNKRNQLKVVAISLDKEPEALISFIRKNNLTHFINYSEYTGWDGEIAKKYNVFATPTMYLLDEDKKIIAKPSSIKALERSFNKIN